MNNQSNESWTELLKNASIKEMKLILYLQYLLYGIISKWFFFFVNLFVVFGIAFYFVEYKNVSSVMYLQCLMIHFCIIFIFCELLRNKDDKSREETWHDIEEIRELISKKRINNNLS
jgi:hypothetical protein